MKFLKTLLLALACFVASPTFANPPTQPVLYMSYYQTAQREGWEERGEEWIHWLAPSVRIGGGSGTICYFDPETKWAYVITCGHLFGGTGRWTYEDAKRQPRSTTVEVFYHNEKKLDEVRKYKAEVLCYERFYQGNWDVGLIRFKADWDIEWYLPIGPKDIKLEKGKMYHSLGCDGRSEVAHYLVEYIEEQDTSGSVTQIKTQKNSPRGGRSGGGVFTDEGELIFICSRSGNGYGYWTSLNQIHKLLEREKEFTYLLHVPRPWDILNLPVFDLNGKQRPVPKAYVPRL